MISSKIKKAVTPAKAVRLRRTELVELTGFPLKFTLAKAGAGMTKMGRKGLFMNPSN
jgi:hypothetical protein